MKKLIPYLLAYLIVAGGTAVYSHFARHAHASPYPPNSVTVITKLSHDELAAKLQQVGLPEAEHLQTMTVSPAPVASLVYHFAFYAVIFAAFAGLTLLFQRVVCTNCKSHDVAA
jgi:uncharacterized membrane protein YagU involved in acid resistance